MYDQLLYMTISHHVLSSFRFDAICTRVQTANFTLAVVPSSFSICCTLDMSLLQKSMSLLHFILAGVPSSFSISHSLAFMIVWPFSPNHCLIFSLCTRNLLSLFSLSRPLALSLSSLSLNASVCLCLSVPVNLFATPTAQSPRLSLSSAKETYMCAKKPYTCA